MVIKKGVFQNIKSPRNPLYNWVLGTFYFGRGKALPVNASDWSSALVNRAFEAITRFYHLLIRYYYSFSLPTNALCLGRHCLDCNESQYVANRDFLNLSPVLFLYISFDTASRFITFCKIVF